MLLSGLPNSAARHIILPRDRTRITRLHSRWLCAIFHSPCVYTVLRSIGRWSETCLDLPLGMGEPRYAIVLAIGFETQQTLFAMEIRGEKGIRINDHWDATSQGVAQAYFGTRVSSFPNFFMMGL